KHEVAERGKHLRTQRTPRAPMRNNSRSRSAMDFNDHRVFLRRIVALRHHEPALHVKFVAGPFDGDSLTPNRLDRAVEMRERPCLATAIDPDLRRLGKGA